MSLPVFVSAGAGAGGAGGSLPINYPASIAAGDLVVLWLAYKYSSVSALTMPAAFTVPSGATVTGGPGGTGVDTGDVSVAVGYRIIDGTEGASVTANFSPNVNVVVAQMYRFTKLSGETWDVAAASGQSNTPGLAFSATMGSNPGITTDDMVVVVGSVNTDTPTRTAEAVTVAGATFGAATELNDGGNGTGDDIGFFITTHPCTSGPAAAAPVYSATNSSGLPAGAAVLLRLRASVAAPPPSPSAGSGSAGESVSFVFSPPPRSTGLSYFMHDRVSPAPPAVRPADLARQFGRDIKFANDTEVSPDGRYVLVEQARALRQAVYHCLVTPQGAIRRLPGYGVGLPEFIGKPITAARVAEIKSRLQEGLLQLRRVDSVKDVAVDSPDAYSIRAHVAVVAAGRLVRFQPFDFRRTS